jgi:GDP-4-dehydro-6-deoxy-D-mannose reductase
VKALVTGAGGFCGRHLVQHLLSRGVEVHTVGPRPASARHHLLDPFDDAALAAAATRTRPDYVFHLAGVSSGTDIVAYYRANTLYAATLFRALDAAGVGCPVLLAGTSAEYGIVSADQLPIAEETTPRPYNHYGISKLAQTQMGLAAGRSRPVVVVRAFNIIGPGMPPHGAVQSFARQIADIMAGRRPPVLAVGNLDTTRDFVAVEDAVAAYCEILRRPEAYGQVINLCSGVETSMRHVVDALVAEAGVPIDVRIDPALVKPVDVPRHYGSVTRLRTVAEAVPDGRVAPMLQRVLAALAGAS